MNSSATSRQASSGELPIAVQMSTLQYFGTTEEQFAQVQRAGVRYVETVDMHGLNGVELKALLAKYGLAPISSHVPLAKMRAGIGAVIAEQKAVGAPVVTLPAPPPEEIPTDAAGWEALGREFGGYAQTLAAAGFGVAYHNHAEELVDFNGRTGLEILFEAAGDVVKAELDVAWVARAGLDPALFLKHLKGRVFAVHSKDNAPAGTALEQKGFAALGTGVLNWNEILPAAHAAGAQWYIIEHDMPSDAEAVVTVGNAFLSARLPGILSK